MWQVGGVGGVGKGHETATGEVVPLCVARPAGTHKPGGEGSGGGCRSGRCEPARRGRMWGLFVGLPANGHAAGEEGVVGGGLGDCGG